MRSRAAGVGGKAGGYSQGRLSQRDGSALAFYHRRNGHDPSVGTAAGCLDIDAADARSFGQDYLHYLMKVPLEANPGDVFRYTDAAFYLLSRVVEQRAGRHLDDFLWREILYPLGFRRRLSAAAHLDTLSALPDFMRGLPTS